MTAPDIFLVSVLRALVELTLWVFLGQGILYLFAGRKRHDNFIYGLFQMVTKPVVSAVRAITPRVVADAHIPLAATFLLFWLWIGLAYLKRYLCVVNGVVCD